MVQDSDYSISINQNNYISSITETALLPIEGTKDKTSPLSNEGKKLHISAIGQLNCVVGISRPDIISCSVYKASTKFKNATIKDVLYVNRIIKNVKSTDYSIKFPQLSMDDLKLQLITYASSNNLPNGGSQAGHIFS